jgi:hypothetical protein
MGHRAQRSVIRGLTWCWLAIACLSVTTCSAFSAVPNRCKPASFGDAAIVTRMRRRATHDWQDERVPTVPARLPKTSSELSLDYCREAFRQATLVNIGVEGQGVEEGGPVSISERVNKLQEMVRPGDRQESAASLFGLPREGWEARGLENGAERQKYAIASRYPTFSTPSSFMVEEIGGRGKGPRGEMGGNEGSGTSSSETIDDAYITSLKQEVRDKIQPVPTSCA